MVKLNKNISEVKDDFSNQFESYLSLHKNFDILGEKYKNFSLTEFFLKHNSGKC